MSGLTKLFLFFSFHNILVQCIIPTFNVQQIDQRLIKKKRQDTLDMCRIFNAEIERLKRSDPLQNLYVRTRVPLKRRKRSLDSLNPALNLEDARRVENIVDRMYDDIQEDGKEILYRRKIFDNLTTKQPPKKEEISSGRRFDFAPAELLGPGPGPIEHTLDTVDAISPPINWTKHWRHGIVPYFIDAKTYDTHLAELIIDAFNYFERSTCIRLQRLREKPTDDKSLSDVEWIYITNPSGIKQCVHSNERKINKGVQVVVFGYDCMSMGEILHEVMHVLGFSHEHTRPDRDQHLTILWQNIKPGYRKYFALRTDDPLLLLPYDYASILHYPPRAFSKNGQYTIMTPDGSKIGQREGLSESDVAKVGMIFGNECMERNKQYLETTCPSVAKANPNQVPPIEPDETKKYFEDRLWPLGIVNYMFRDKVEFSMEERENIKAVMRHIEKETCVVFRNVYEEMEKVEQYEKIQEDSVEHETVEKNTLLQNSSIKSFPIASTPSTENSSIPKNQLDGDNTIDLHSLRTNKLNSGKLELKKGGNGFGKLKRKMRHVAIKKAPSPLPQRRHSNDVYKLIRTTKPGCRCPNPGKVGGDKDLEISSDCFNSANDLLHLFVHVLGLDHQHNMYDRDSYIHIVWNNLTAEIKEEMQEKLPPGASVGLPYDYQSVMHYPWLQIKNGISNIMYPIWNDGWAMGHWQGLSSTDVQKINFIYAEQCDERNNAENKKEAS